MSGDGNGIERDASGRFTPGQGAREAGKRSGAARRRGRSVNAKLTPAEVDAVFPTPASIREARDQLGLAGRLVASGRITAAAGQALARTLEASIKAFSADDGPARPDPEEWNRFQAWQAEEAEHQALPPNEARERLVRRVADLLGLDVAEVVAFERWRSHGLMLERMPWQRAEGLLRASEPVWRAAVEEDRQTPRPYWRKVLAEAKRIVHGRQPIPTVEPDEESRYPAELRVVH